MSKEFGKSIMNTNKAKTILFDDPIGENIVITKNSVKVNLTLDELLDQELEDGVEDLLENVIEDDS